MKRCKFSRKRTEKEESDLELGATPEKVKKRIRLNTPRPKLRSLIIDYFRRATLRLESRIVPARLVQVGARKIKQNYKGERRAGTVTSSRSEE